MQLDFAVREADFLKADSLYRRLPPPRFDTLKYQLMHAIKTRDVARQDAIYEAYTKTTDAQPAEAGYWIVHDMHLAEPARRFAPLGLSGNRSDDVKQRAEFALANVDIEQGRVRSALSHLDRVREQSRVNLEFAYADNPLFALPAERLARLRDQVLKSDSSAGEASMRERLRPHQRLYRLGVLSCMSGDVAAARGYAQRLRQLETPDYWQPSIALLANEVDAQADILSGNVNAGLAKLEGARNTLAADIAQMFAFGGTAIMWRAEALYRAQRWEEAGRWFDVLDDALRNTPHVAYILLRRAQVHDARNETGKARELYAQFLDLWSQPDPELKPIADNARRRLAALQSRIN